jgi:glycosyltransferase involved in cell wall biosynthesis
MADGIIVTGDYDIPFIVKCFKLKRKYKKNKIRLFYNFIDDILFKPTSYEKKDKHIIFIGRLSYEKNLFNLLEAFKELNGFVLDIIGTGPEEEKLKHKAKKLGINANFLGIIPNNEIPEKLNQYQIFILPSFSEGNPKALLEAMSCGVACIGTNVKGINNIIKHKQNGYLCEKSPISIKKAILNLYNDENFRKKLGKNARKFILDNCSLTSLVEKEYLFYQEILRR